MQTGISPESRDPQIRTLLAYVADLELEVDRLRKQIQFVRHDIGGGLKQIRALCADANGSGEEHTARSQINSTVKELAGLLRDLHEAASFHPAHDQVIAIAVRPLIERVFRWQQRLERAPQVILRLELESEHVEWFPARLRHILDNLVSNSLKYRDAGKAESWVCVKLRVGPEAYEFSISDNGVGLEAAEQDKLFQLFHRAALTRAPGLGVGLAVAKLLVEESDGTLTVDSGKGQGTTFAALLPRFDVDDFLL